MAKITVWLASQLCEGSSRKLIAGWWYSILSLSLIMTLISLWVMSNRSPGEGFSSIWSSIMMVLLSVGGTMIMRRFHNSMAVGFFIGSIVASSQLFFLLFLVFISYASDRILLGNEARKEHLMAILCMIQAMLLGFFAVILGAHRTEILEKPNSPVDIVQQLSKDGSLGSANSEGEGYNPPVV